MTFVLRNGTIGFTCLHKFLKNSISLKKLTVLIRDIMELKILVSKRPHLQNYFTLKQSIKNNIPKITKRPKSPKTYSINISVKLGSYERWRLYFWSNNNMGGIRESKKINNSFLIPLVFIISPQQAFYCFDVIGINPNFFVKNRNRKLTTVPRIPKYASIMSGVFRKVINVSHSKFPII